MAKIFRKSLKALLILLVVAYFIALFKVKYHINEFIHSHDYSAKIDYSWLFIDWQGNLQIKNLSLYNLSDQPLIRARWSKIEFPSRWSVLQLDNWLVYQQFPASLKIHLQNAYTTSHLDFSEHNPDSQSKILDSWLPEMCRQTFTPPKPFAFDMVSELNYDALRENLEIELDFTSVGLVDFHFQAALKDMQESNYAHAYISSANLTAKNIIWLQHSIQQCVEANQLEQQAIGKLFSDNLVLKAKQFNLQLNDKFVENISSFFYSPQLLAINYAPKETYRLRQMVNLPLQMINQSFGMEVNLDGKLNRTFFTVNNELAIITEKQANKDVKKITESRSYLPTHARGLINFIGAQVKLNFKHQPSLTGRIEKVATGKVFLSQFKFNGRSILPYSLAEIESIELVTNR